MPAANLLRRSALVAAGLLVSAAVPFALRGADGGEDDPLPAKSDKPKHYVAPASDEAAQAMRQFSLPGGWKVDLFAAEPRLANPVCFSIDNLGRVYVVETFRRRNAVLDIRKLPSWLDDDLANRTVADRIAMVKRRMPNDWQKLEGITDRIRLIEDTDGDGRADKDTVFADKFDKLEDGTAAGVLPFDGSVYFTDIPNLWKLKDTNGDGVADERESLAYGFGVRYAFSGHDFHGLRMGPDGRLYFSIADRGLHVEKDGKVVVDNPDSGAVLRCEPDGSNLELVHTGLRNPQELAFDEFGNLFTGDNNSDAGDPSRWVYVVEGGESGWHCGWQWITGPVSRGPWMGEELCQVNPKVPAFYRLPPIATPKIAGPAGLTYAPGTGLGPEWAGRFFLVDFRGGPAGGSGVYALKNKPKGASFELEEMKELVTNVLPTDVDFGPDGRIYFTDWISGWEPHGKGRIYALTPPGQDAAQVAEVKKLLAEPFAPRAEAELAKLLGHADQRVRQKAQFELAKRGEKGVAALAGVAGDAAVPQLARIHAVWGLGQIARKTPGDSPAAKAVLPLLADGDAEVKAQAAKVAGDAKLASAGATLAKLASSDRNARVKFFAGNALGKLHDVSAADAALTLLRRNNDSDAYLRHAGVMALAGMAAADPTVLEKAAADESSAVRMAALLAYRKQKSPAVARFLADADPNLVLEASRAVNDLTINDALPKLAALSAKQGLSEPVLFRVLNANYRLGTADSAKALAAFAGRSDAPAAMRVEALRMLGAWASPSGRDRVTGLWRPVPARDGTAAQAALAPALDGLLKGTAPDAVRVAALNASIALGINTTPLAELVKDEKNPVGLRSAAIAAMAERKDKGLAAASAVALASKDEPLRIAALRVQPGVAGGMKVLADVLASGTPREQQAAIQTAAAAGGAKDKTVASAADALLADAFSRLESGKLPPEAHLDLLDAAAAKKKGKLFDRGKAYAARREAEATADALAPYRAALAGGDAERGAFVFRERADVACMRCHNIKGVGGNAGPDLSGVFTRGGGPAASAAHAPAGREHILESIVYPAKKIAPGWETVSVRTTDDEVVAGVLKAEDATTITLDVPNVGPVKVAKAKVAKRQGGLSGMPEDVAKTLTKQDLRDLVEFLAGQ
ncbi:MAG TPA: PVC-type heme-binding CxxCH protein [Humisphaera sp.]